MNDDMASSANANDSAPLIEGTKGRTFDMIFTDQKAGEEMALDKRIKDFDRKMMLVLMRRMNSRNEVRLRQEEIAKIVGVSVPRTCLSLGVLRRTGYIAIPHRGEIHVSPYVAWSDKLMYNANARTRYKQISQEDKERLRLKDESRDLAEAI